LRQFGNHVNAPDRFALGSSTAVAKGADAKGDRQMEVAITEAQSRLGDRLGRRTESGEPVRRILELASAESTDLIVMGTHEHIGRLQALFGSVTENIVRSSLCPVLIVRRPAGEGESFADRIHGTPAIANQTRPSR
jgi:nucleotide-binding universal stress UspA family protein